MGQQPYGPSPPQRARAAAEAFFTPDVRTLIRVKARQLCRRPGFSRSDQEDLTQELSQRLIEKIPCYDASRGVSTDGFATCVINSEVCMILRARKRKKRAAGYRALSLESTRVTGAQGMEPAVLRDRLDAADRERVTLSSSDGDAEETQCLQHAVGDLPPDLANLAQRLMQGTATSVARDLGISRRQLAKAMKPFVSRRGTGWWRSMPTSGRASCTAGCRRRWVSRAG